MDGWPQSRLRAQRGGIPALPRVAADLAPATYAAGVAIAVAIGAALRLQRVLSADFPLHDGGLIYAMVRDLQAASFRMPTFSSYNGGQVPFAYPPLGIYLAAALDRLTPAGVLDLLRFLPLAFSLLSVGAFALLARSLLPGRGAALAATLLFTAYSQGFAWFIMGGGLPRSLGLLFALLTLLWLHRLCLEGRPLYAGACGVAAGLALLSHVEMAWFMGLSALLLLLFHGLRDPWLWRWGAVAAACAALVSAPWWGSVLVRYGPDTLLAPGSSRPLFSIEELSRVFTYHLGHSLPFLVVLALALLGASASLREGRPFLLVWLAVGAFAAPWLFPRLTGLPLHLLGGLGWQRLVRPWAAAFLAVTCALGLALAALTATDPLPIDEPLSLKARQAMAWAADNLPSGSLVVVVENRSWWDDVAAEWLPSLTPHLSVVTPQGLEWVPGAFNRRVKAYESLQKCAEQGVDCLWAWTAETGLRYQYVWVSKEPRYDLRQQGYDDCCGPLRRSLSQSLDFETVYDGPGATIFRRTGLP